MSLSLNKIESFRAPVEKSIKKNGKPGHLDRFISVEPKFDPTENIHPETPDINNLDKTNHQSSIKKISDLKNRFEVCPIDTIINQNGNIAKQNIVYLDHKLNLKVIEVTPESAIAFLKEVKDEDLQLLKQGKKSNSYELRKILFVLINQIENAKLHSYHAFIYNPSFEIENGKLITDPKIEKNWVHFLENEAIWIPERKTILDKITSDALINISNLSEAINNARKTKGEPIPAIIMFRGNSCSGKTSNLSEDARISINNGIINPDTYKNILKAEFITNHTIPFDQFLIHREGAIIAQKLIKHPANQDKTLVIDKRHTNKKDYNDIKMNDNRHIEMIITDSPVDLCLSRLLNRNPLGKSPCVAPNTVIEGHKDLRLNHLAIITDILRNDSATFTFQLNHNQTHDSVIITEEYVKIGTDQLSNNPDNVELKYIDIDHIAKTPTIKSLTKSKQIKTIQLFIDVITAHQSTEESEYCENLVINDELIKTLNNKYGNSPVPQYFLKEYYGHKLTDVLSLIAQGKIKIELDKNNYLQTFNQITHQDFYEPLLNEDKEVDRIDEIFDEIWKQSGKNFTSKEDISKTVASLIKVITTQPSINSRLYSKFSNKLFTYLEKGNENPRSVAAWIEYEINRNNILKIEKPELVAKTLACWYLIYLNHCELPMKSNWQQNKNLTFKEFVSLYIEKSF